MKRRSLSRRSSRKVFNRGNRVHRDNISPRPIRGGIRK